MQPQGGNQSLQLVDEERSLTIAVVGDVHDQWEAEDEVALYELGVDLVLFVGDFGNEAVELVRAIARIELPKAVILGNHDAWYTATDWGRKKCPYNRAHEDRVQQQLDLLGKAHVGYGKLDFPNLDLTVIGGRPFSWGGGSWKHERFYREWYGVHSFEESATVIMSSLQAADHNTVIFIGHCGPAGLGDRPEDPCGRDWKPMGGDFGDPDLAAAITQAHRMGKQVPLVTFGHMHHHLRHTKERLRKMIDVSPNGTVYLNSACVPRIIGNGSDRQRNFSLVRLRSGEVIYAALVWVNSEFKIVSEQVLYQEFQPIAPVASM
jgi:uncharacterized protein (TIGR04168 family)